MSPTTTSDPSGDEAERTRRMVHERRDEFVDLLTRLCRIESPTDHPATQTDVHAVLGPAFEELGYDVRIVPGRTSGNHFLAMPARRTRGAPTQLLMGHTDTVWPIGTLDRMPVEMDGDVLRGPGTLDMKGGLTQIVIALRTLRDLGREPAVTPVVFMNSDEETGSPDSKRHVARLARRASRALILEPALGEQAKIKTARKGVGRFGISITGRASHAGLDPESGASAIVELSHVVRSLHALNAPERGMTVNVGVVRGGTRPNVVAAAAHAEVDVRVTTTADGEEIERRIRALEPVTPGVSLSVEGGVRIAPLERTPRNRLLWEQTRSVGADLGFELEEALAGGGSDGNTTSLHTATVDGLGCVGDGAHADHEHIVVGPSLDRCALLARLLLAPIAKSEASVAPTTG